MVDQIGVIDLVMFTAAAATYLNVIVNEVAHGGQFEALE
jgi:hypothetical protein